MAVTHKELGPGDWPVEDWLEVERRRYAAEKVRVTAGYFLSDSRLIERGSIEELRDECMRGLCYRLETYIVGMPSERIVVHKRWPADWWQAFRERWFPAWYLKRHPVRYERVDVDQQLYAAVCPHVDVPGDKQHLEWMTAQLSRKAHRS